MQEQPKIITLSQPISAHGETLTELSFRPPTGRDFREAGRTDEMWDFRLMGALCAIPPSVIDDMPMRDVLKLQQALRDFLADTTPRTSATPTSDAPGSGEGA